MERFCLAMVEATSDLAVAFKPNLAFFEQYGAAGWAALERVVAGIQPFHKFGLKEGVRCWQDFRQQDIPGSRRTVPTP